MGRHPYQPSQEDRDRVKRLASFKLPFNEIAKLTTNRQTGKPVDVHILRRDFVEELEIGHLELYVQVADKYACRLTGAPAEFDENRNMIRAEIVASERAQEKFLETFGPKYGWGEPPDPLGDLDTTKLNDLEFATFKALYAKARKVDPDVGGAGG